MCTDFNHFFTGRTKKNWGTAFLDHPVWTLVCTNLLWLQQLRWSAVRSLRYHCRCRCKYQRVTSRQTGTASLHWIRHQLSCLQRTDRYFLRPCVRRLQSTSSEFHWEFSAKSQAVYTTWWIATWKFHFLERRNRIAVPAWSLRKLCTWNNNNIYISLSENVVLVSGLTLWPNQVRPCYWTL